MTVDCEMMLGPEWRSKFSMIYTWETKVARGIYGYEQRSGLYGWPRRTIRYDVSFMSEAESAYFTRVMRNNQGSIFGVPVWGEENQLTVQAPSSQAYVRITDGDKMNFEVGGYVVMWNGYKNYELKQISSMTSTQLNFASGLAAIWSAGTVVYPVIHGTVEQNIPYRKITSAYGGASLLFKEAWSDDVTHILGSHSFPSYQGYPVFNLEPSWSPGFGLSIARPTEQLENFGVQLRITRESESEFLLDVEYLLMSLAENSQMWGFFNAVEGKWKQFWVPTWQRDIVITGKIEITDDFLTIQDIDYSNSWASNHIIGKYLALLFPDGTYVYRKIIGWPSSTRINLDAQIGKGIGVTVVRTVLASFLLPARFDVDEMELRYAVPGVSQTRLRIQSLFDENMTTTTTI